MPDVHVHHVWQFYGNAPGRDWEFGCATSQECADATLRKWSDG